MVNIWDTPPIPRDGDELEDSTYIGIGKVISNWSSLEVALSSVYSLMVGKHSQLDALRKYGEARIFASRMMVFEKAADLFFIINPNQLLEGELCKIGVKIRGFADRRNDVAHGIVRFVKWDIFPSSPIAFADVSFFGKTFAVPDITRYILAPPEFIGKKFDANSMPIYLYGSKELTELAKNIFIAESEILDFKRKLEVVLMAARSSRL